MSGTCDILKDYIETKNGNVTYGECLYFLNNKTSLTQIGINNCLMIYFPIESRKVCDKWIGIS